LDGKFQVIGVKAPREAENIVSGRYMVRLHLVGTVRDIDDGETFLLKLDHFGESLDLARAVAGSQEQHVGVVPLEISQEVCFLHDGVSLKTKDLHQFGEILPGGVQVFDNEDLSQFHFISSALAGVLPVTTFSEGKSKP
jgi:hypothetical protein